MALIVLTTSAGDICYNARLLPPVSSTPSPSMGNGTAQLMIDTSSNTMNISIVFANLMGLTTAVHIQGPTALSWTGFGPIITMTPSLQNFPLGVTSGNYFQTVDLASPSSYSAEFLAGTATAKVSPEAFFLASLANTTAYLAINTLTFPQGEIEGFLLPCTSMVSTSVTARAPSPITLQKLRGIVQIV